MAPAPLRDFVARVFGLRPPAGPPTERFRAATVLLVWVPLLSLFIVGLSQFLTRALHGTLPHVGLQIFAVALFATLIWLLRLPAPRVVRLMAIPAIPLAAAAWLLAW